MYIPFDKCIEANRGKPFNGVIHIGAHHGEEAQAYCDNGIKNVLWVEANPRMMKHLYDKTRDIPIKSKYFNAVLSDADDQSITLHVANNGQSSSILELGTHAQMYPHIQYVDHIKTKSKRFDTMARECVADIDLSLYDFVNLDVQGAELKVLKGFGNLFDLYPFKAVYCEINLEEVYKGCCLVEELDEYLSKFGFERVLTATPEGTWGDGLFIRK